MFVLVANAAVAMATSADALGKNAFVGRLANGRRTAADDSWGDKNHHFGIPCLTLGRLEKIPHTGQPTQPRNTIHLIDRLSLHQSTDHDGFTVFDADRRRNTPPIDDGKRVHRQLIIRRSNVFTDFRFLNVNRHHIAANMGRDVERDSRVDLLNVLLKEHRVGTLVTRRLHRKEGFSVDRDVGLLAVLGHHVR